MDTGRQLLVFQLPAASAGVLGPPV
jgi:hypothetical protein